MNATVLGSSAAKAVSFLESDLTQIFGARLESLVVYGRHVPGDPAAADATPREAVSVDDPVRTLALVRELSYDDLVASAARHEAWERAGLATPLLLSPDEFTSSLDVFPLEYGAIIARHVAVVGTDPFNDVAVSIADLRRACEVQAKSHLIHLREAFMEADADPSLVVDIVRHSVPSFSALIGNLARLDGVLQHDPGTLARHIDTRAGLSATLVARLLTMAERPGAGLSEDEAMQIYPPYLDAVERLARFVDGWKAPAQS